MIIQMMTLVFFTARIDMGEMLEHKILCKVLGTLTINWYIKLSS